MTYFRYTDRDILTHAGSVSGELLRSMDRVRQVVDFLTEIGGVNGLVAKGFTTEEAQLIVDTYTRGKQLVDIFDGVSAGPANPYDVRADFARILGPTLY